MLQLALDHGDYETATILLDHGGFSLASWKDRKEVLLRYIRDPSFRLEAIRLILKHCSDLSNMRAGVEDWTLIHVAIKMDHIECVRLLLEYGADPNRRCHKYGKMYSPLSP